MRKDYSAMTTTALPLVCIVLAALVAGCQLPWTIREPLTEGVATHEPSLELDAEELSSSIRLPPVSNASISSLSEETR